MRNLFRVWETLEVRWADMDAFGHVNNAKYFTYCESARVRYFDAVGLDDYRDAGQGPTVVTACFNFLRQVHYPATLEVGARVTEISKRSFTLDYVLLRQGTDEIVADASTIIAWIDFSAGKSVALPPELREKIRSFDELD